MTPRQSADTALAALALVALTLASATPAFAAPRFERVLTEPCRALALDREPYVAALGDDAVSVFDKRGQHRERLPDALRGPGLDVGVYFGRDYRVRVAGTAHTAKGDELRYYRSLPAGIVPALDELGPLGKAGGPGLIALLGTTDPEIVCRPGQTCLIKRVSGWSNASVPAGLSRVGLSPSGGWAIAAQTLFRLAHDWAPLPAGPWQHADDALLRDDQACVIEHDTSRLHHFDGAAWHSSASPVSGPRSLWTSGAALWIAGDSGAAVLDESGHVDKVEAVTHISQVLGRTAHDVWLCSANGLYHSAE